MNSKKAAKLEAKLEGEFDNFIASFHEMLFTVDWDSPEPEIAGWNIFAGFNDGWIKFANTWNHQRGHILMANTFAFYNYAINQDGEPRENRQNSISLRGDNEGNGPRLGRPQFAEHPESGGQDVRKRNLFRA